MELVPILFSASILPPVIILRQGKCSDSTVFGTYALTSDSLVFSKVLSFGMSGDKGGVILCGWKSSSSRAPLLLFSAEIYTVHGISVHM